MQHVPFDPRAHGWSQVDEDGFGGRIGPFWQRHVDGRLVVAVQADAGHANRNGVVHGGLILALADQGLGMVCYQHTDRTKHATIQLDVHFVAAARPGQFLECHARVDRRAGGVAFLRGEIRVGDRVIATADGIWKLFETPRG